MTVTHTPRNCVVLCRFAGHSGVLTTCELRMEAQRRSQQLQRQLEGEPWLTQQRRCGCGHSYHSTGMGVAVANTSEVWVLSRVWKSAMGLIFLLKTTSLNPSLAYRTQDSGSNKGTDTLGFWRGCCLLVCLLAGDWVSLSSFGWCTTYYVDHSLYVWPWSQTSTCPGSRVSGLKACATTLHF